MVNGDIKSVQIPEPPNNDLNIIVVIPCFNETDLQKTLDSLWHTSRPVHSVEIIVVINSSETVFTSTVLQNIRTYYQILQWCKDHCDDKLKFHILFYPAFSLKLAGVALARIAGMNEALRRFKLANNLKGIIVSLDADTICEPNYLQAIEEHFNKYPQTPGCDIYFEHPLTGDLGEDVYNATAMFELLFRYKVNFGKACGLTPSFHIAGAAQAARAEAYERVGGMVFLKHNEDVVYIRKIISLGNFTSLNNTTLHPATRISYRTHGGSTSVISNFINRAPEEPKDKPDANDRNYVSQTEIIIDIKNTLSFLNDIYNSQLSVISFEELKKKMPPNVLQFIVENKIPFNADEINYTKLKTRDKNEFIDIWKSKIFLSGTATNSADYDTYATSKFYPKIILVEACRTFLVKIHRYKMKEVSKMDYLALLREFRKLDKEYLNEVLEEK